jgi:hypothetical protein
MFRDDNTGTPQETRDVEQELDFLYARRDVINSLIASLEEYDRYRSTSAPRQQRKSA